MAEVNKFYKCETCGNIVFVEEAGAGELVCCGKPMKLFEEKDKSSEGAGEKHVPLISVDGNTVTVTVGEVAHPMEEDHHISLIRLITEDGVVMEKHLKAGEKPEAIFHVENTTNLKAKEVCNLHGVWVSD